MAEVPGPIGSEVGPEENKNKEDEGFEDDVSALFQLPLLQSLPGRGAHQLQPFLLLPIPGLSDT
ncbi:hypothetical protein RUM43_006571 [Polyplax serrata]|uniref:Uncharacterized protein n=1 Tax=Polyplax serrata TaxID=468196 RepID=A0AAN8PF60_POLSC